MTHVGTPRHTGDHTEEGARGRVNLRHERRRRGLTEQQIADAIGISRQVWRGAERGSTPVPANQALIAAYFGVDVIVQWPDPTEVAA